MEVEVKLEQDDLVAFNLFYLRHSREVRRLRRRAVLSQIVGMLLVVAIILGLLYYAQFIETVFQAVLFFALWAAIFILLFMICDRAVLKRQIRRVATEGEDRSLLARKTYSLSEQSISFEGELSSGRMSWRAVEDVAETDEHIFILLSKQRAYVLPKRAFRTPEEANRFLELAREYRHRAVQAGAPSG